MMGIDEVGAVIAALLTAGLERDGELMPIEGLYEEALAQWSCEIDLRLVAEAECRRLRAELARLSPKECVVAPCNTFAPEPTPKEPGRCE
jgi:hypothetical protein